MIDIETTAEAPTAIEADALVVGAYEKDDGFELTQAGSVIDDAVSGAVRAHLAALRFEAKADKVRAVPVGDGVRAPVVFVVGLGERGRADANTLRSAAAAAARAATRLPAVATTLATDLDDVSAATAAVVEGTVLATYRFLDYKTEPKAADLARLVLVGGDQVSAAAGRAGAEATLFARTLANTPAADLRPRHLAQAAQEAADAAGLDIEIWDADRIASERLGGIAAVAAGSVEEPRFIQLRYEPEGGVDATLAFVGKGITFDSGGLSLKSADHMEKQKTDMSGAATVIAAMSVLGELAPPVKVLGFIPAAENMPGPAATKPGDVFSARNGKTVEVVNTDAEGRLILADALSLAAEAGPDAIVDVATLTGSCVVALGQKYGGLFSNDDVLAAQLLRAAARAGEPLWRLPLADEYRKQLDSSVADMRNTGSRFGGAITAALFLEAFAGELPWAHIDVAGPARSDSDDGYLTKGGTGFGVRTLLNLVRSFEPPDKPSG